MKTVMPTGLLNGCSSVDVHVIPHTFPRSNGTSDVCLAMLSQVAMDTSSTRAMDTSSTLAMDTSSTRAMTSKPIALVIVCCVISGYQPVFHSCNRDDVYHSFTEDSITLSPGDLVQAMSPYPSSSMRFSWDLGQFRNTPAVTVWLAEINEYSPTPYPVLEDK